MFLTSKTLSVMPSSHKPGNEKANHITPAAAGGAGLFTNLTFGNTSNLRKAARGNGPAIIAYNGDSTTRGVDTSASPFNTQYSNGLPNQVANVLSTLGKQGTCNNWFGFCGTSMSDFLTRDGRVTVTGTTVFSSDAIQGGQGAAQTTVGDTFVFTTPTNCDTADIYWRDAAVGRNWSWSVDGGSATTVNSTGVSRIAKTTIPLGSIAPHSITISLVLAVDSIYGIDCYTSGSVSTEIRNWSMGISGGTSANMINNTGTPNAGRFQQFQNFPPSLIITEMGLVNDWRTSISVASSQANMDSFANFAKNTLTNTDLIFMTPPYDGSTGGFVSNQNAYVQAMYEVANKYNVPVFDIRKKWLSWNNSVANGWQVVADAVHPTKAGYTDQAQQLISGLISFM